jgi:hypothetical protein
MPKTKAIPPAESKQSVQPPEDAPLSVGTAFNVVRATLQNYVYELERSGADAKFIATKVNEINAALQVLDPNQKG